MLSQLAIEMLVRAEQDERRTELRRQQARREVRAHGRANDFVQTIAALSCVALIAAFTLFGSGTKVTNALSPSAAAVYPISQIASR
jgi:hypothetical protein